ncbi:MAG TPA: DsrE family protein, partial [Hyphomicrobiaceae bacterium]|nr:DsrE family protein [Hyphomicrobiaceae bacterium]
MNDARCGRGEFDMKILFILNDAPYGTERVYNALRLAHALTERDMSAEVIIFLMADAVVAAKARQKTPEGYYNVERMLKGVLGSQGLVLLCG